MQPLVKVFVYGTLKPEEVNYWVCASQVVEAESAIAQGSLYHLPLGYPAMIPGARGIVRGAVLSFANLEILTVLDEFEQHEPEEFRRYACGQSLQTNQYHRQLIETFSPTRSPLGLAWGYGMTQEQVRCLGGILVPSGRWSRGQEN